MLPLISLVVPCYNEEAALPLFYQAASAVADGMDPHFEFIFVDDGSRDGTLEYIRELKARDERVRYISFSRNFGKEAAILAGLRAARGDYVALLDADLQDPPSLLPEMYRRVRDEGYDSAAARRATRSGEPYLRSFFARAYYRLMRRISDAGLMGGARDFRLMTRRMTDAVLSLSERGRFTKGIFGWVGFRTAWISYDNIQRAAGSTKWSFWRLFRYSLGGTAEFSNAPLAIPAVLGTLSAAAGIIWAAVLTVMGSTGAAAYLACLILFMGGAILISAGILGLYIAKIYHEVKARPEYIVAETDEG